jgi:hypothetical protein
MGRYFTISRMFASGIVKRFWVPAVVVEFALIVSESREPPSEGGNTLAIECLISRHEREGGVRLIPVGCLEGTARSGFTGSVSA